MENNTERWVSSKDISEHLGINKDTLHKWIKNETTITTMLCFHNNNAKNIEKVNVRKPFVYAALRIFCGGG